MCFNFAESLKVLCNREYATQPEKGSNNATSGVFQRINYYGGRRVLTSVNKWGSWYKLMKK